MVDEKTPTTSRIRRLALAGLGAAGLGLLAVRARAALRESAPAVKMPAPPPAAAVPVESAAPEARPPESPAVETARPAAANWPVLILLVGLSAAGLIGLQNAAPEVSGALFGLLLAAAVGTAAWRARGRAAAEIERAAAGGANFLHSAYRVAALPLHWLAARRRFSVPALAAGAVGLLALATWSFQIARYGDRPLDEPLFFLACGTVALWGAIKLRGSEGVETPADVAAVKPLGRANWIIAGLGLIPLAVTAEISGGTLRLEALQQASPHLQLFLLALGMGLVVWGLGGGRRALEGVRLSPGWRWTALTLLLILALAFVVRYWQLGTLVRYLVDEMNTIPEVTAFGWTNKPVKLLTEMSGISPFPWVFAYGQWAGTWFLGDTLEGIRLASVITGVLTVLALYILARALFDRTTALAAALLLAAFPPHIHFSRLALLNIADPLAGTLALAFVARAVVYNRRLDYALAGGFLGLTQYFYNGGKLFYIPLAALWITLLAISRRKSSGDTGRVNWRGLGITVLALALTAAPVYYTMWAQGYPLVGRMEASGLSGAYWQDLIARGDFGAYFYRLGWALRYYVQNPDDTVYYGGDTPLVLPALLPVFLVGAAYCLARRRYPGPLLLLLWLAAGALGNSILVMNAASTRFVIVFPALPLLVAAGARYVLPLFWPPRAPVLALRLSLGIRRRVRWRWPPRDVPRHLRRVVVALALAAAGLQIAYYFGPHMDYYNRQLRLHHGFPDGYDAIFRTQDFPRDTQVHIISASPFSQMDAQGLSDFLRGGLYFNTLAAADLDEDYLKALRCGVDHAFFIQPGDSRTLALLKKYFYLRAPEYSSYGAVIPDERELVLYYAPYLRGLEAIYGRQCD